VVNQARCFFFLPLATAEPGLDPHGLGRRRDRSGHGRPLRERQVSAARDLEADRRLARGELDATQDHIIDALATSLVADGFSRIKTVSALPPTKLKGLGEVAEAKASRALAKRMAANKQASSKFVGCVLCCSFAAGGGW
jgi:hypothetical protein